MHISFRSQLIVGLAGFLLLAALLVASTGTPGTPAQRSSDTYVEAMIGAPRLVNPLLAQSDTDTDLTHLVFSGLTKVGDDGRIVPDLASGWDVSPSGTVYTFTLRSGLRWQDGAPLSADDAVFTYHMLQDKGFPGDASLAAPWRTVTVEAPSATQVRLTLRTPDSTFLQYTTMGLLPQHVWSGVDVAHLATSPVNTLPVGSGPWRYVQAQGPAGLQESGDTGVDTGQKPAVTPVAGGVLLEPNPYSREQTRIARLWFRPYPDFGAALTGFKLGEVHGLGHIPAGQTAELAALQGVALHEQPLARYAMLVLNMRSPLLNDAQTRQAIERAIDRQSLIAATGLEATPSDSPVLPHSWAYDPSKQHAPYDPAEARRLLDSAGWQTGSDGIRTRNGVTLTLVLATNKAAAANVEVAQQLAKQLGEVGIKVETAAVSLDSLARDYLSPGAFHLALVTWEADGADPDLSAYWHTTQGGQGALNISGWGSQRADRALDSARAQTSAPAKSASYSDFQEVFARDVPAVILFNPVYVYATREPAADVDLPTYDMLSPAERFDTLGQWYLDTSGAR